jgi:flavin-binding protein dodecin
VPQAEGVLALSLASSKVHWLDLSSWLLLELADGRTPGGAGGGVPPSRGGLPPDEAGRQVRSSQRKAPARTAHTLRLAAWARRTHGFMRPTKTAAKESQAMPSNDAMTSVAKVSEISARSNKSFEDAISIGIARASKTLRNVNSAWIKEQRVEVKNGKVSAYQVNMMITFTLED